MFRYNRFWHVWFQLNNRHYSRAFFASLIISLLLIPAAVFFPPLWGLVVAVPLLVAGTITFFTQLSNFFYSRQNQRLKKIKIDTSNETLKKQIDLYLDLRVVCPKELLAGAPLNLPHDDRPVAKQVAPNAPLIVEREERLTVANVSNTIPRRNPAFTVKSESNQFYVKTVAAKDGLSEVAAREMAEILGFGGLIPSNTIAKTDVLSGVGNECSISSTGLVASRQKIKDLIEQRIKESTDAKIQNSLEVQNAVAKFVFNLKTAAYRTNAQKDKQFKLLHVQKFVHDVVDGLQVNSQLMNEPLPGQFVFFPVSEAERVNQRTQAKGIIQKIDIHSFQENFLLLVLLGSQDANPGNTLFTVGGASTVLYSIDHERIMPENNYDITKRIPLANGDIVEEKDIKNVFPIRLWLAGLPQANIPFTKEIIEKVLGSLNPKRLIAYHHQKKLFSPAAVVAQLERMRLIKDVFEKELKKPNITLTPKELFLKFINNHPTYLFLKKQLKLCDLSTFMLLGQTPEGADLSLLRHPLQFFPIIGMVKEAHRNSQQGLPMFSAKSYKSPHAHHLLFFAIASKIKDSDAANKPGLDVLAETSKQLGLH